MHISAYIGASGAIAQSRMVEAIANNLANASTPGFKKEIPVLEQWPPQRVGSGMRGSAQGPAFVIQRKGFRDISAGSHEKTENMMDVALEGEGYFLLKTPAGEKATRDGRFQISSRGQLVSMEGYPVQGEGGDIVIPGGKVTIDNAGGIQVDGVKIDTMKIVDAAFKPIRKGSFGIKQGYRETSNVQPIEEMVSMMEALRGYQSHMKLLQGISDIEEKTVLDMGKI
jgi:flagellar basal-body rod protein FlgG